MLSRVKRPVQVLFLLLALVFIGAMLWSQWDELQSYRWQLRPLWLLISAGLVVVSWSLEVAIWQSLLRLVGGDLSYGYAIRIWFVSALVRYIPGNIWQPLGMTLLTYHRGVRPEATLTSIALYQAINLLAVALIAAVYFPLTANMGMLAEITTVPLAQLAVFLALPVLLFLARPQWLVRAMNWVLGKIGRTALPVELSTMDLLRVLGLGVIVWLTLGAGFATLVLAISDLSLSYLAQLASHLLVGYPVAYAVGYLSFITPSGLAVREGMLYLLLAPILGGSLATVAALAMRVWLILGELIAAAISLITWPELRDLLRQGEVAKSVPE